MPPQNSCPVQRVQTYLSIRSYMSIQASGVTMSTEQQARKMLTSAADPPEGFVFTGEYYEAYRCFLAGTDPSMPEKTLIHANEMNMDRQLKATGAHSKIHTGETLLAKANRAELQNSYMPLLNKIVPNYPDIGSGRSWDQMMIWSRYLRKGAGLESNSFTHWNE